MRSNKLESAEADWVKLIGDDRVLNQIHSINEQSTFFVASFSETRAIWQVVKQIDESTEASKLNCSFRSFKVN